MCFSSTISYGAAAVLATSGLYAVRTASHLSVPYRMWAVIPVFFGIQQAFEGRVWQLLDEGSTAAAVPGALGFHFFSHFLWLWWLPLCSYLVEPARMRKKVFGACTLFGAFAGTLVYSAMFLHPEWISLAVREHSIHYSFAFPYRSAIHIPITPAALYALTILVPLLFSSHRRINLFGGLALLSMVLTSVAFEYAFVSVWCFFAAGLSLYLVYMIRQVAAEPNPVDTRM